ncbi:MAG: aspartate--tRNA ligase [Alphaproteobacteria bacterium]
MTSTDTLHQYRSHTCGALTAANVGNTVRLSGWVNRKRDHGGLLFIDLRDFAGITQIVLDQDSKFFEAADNARVESVLCITGEVLKRSDETINSKIPTGEIEIGVRDLEVLSSADVLPLQIAGDEVAGEDIRLKYRYLDLRREKMKNNILLRSKVISYLRNKMTEQGFHEFQTPILTASSPEGARDFLVPSRLHPGQFYALPQAPQQFKQLLMMAGFDRYFQIAPCFRDEDSRADRAPGEFYQLDFEMSFVTQEDVFDAIEPVLHGLFTEFANGRSVTPMAFPQIPYKESMEKYGNDKPDLRVPIEMGDVTDHFRGSGFKIFAGMIEKDPKVKVWAIPAKTGGSRAFCDRMNSWAQSKGQPGLGYIFFRNEEGATVGAGPLAKNIGQDRANAIKDQFGLGEGDAVFFVAGIPSAFRSFAAEARVQVGNELGLTEKDAFKFCWIVDFAMYELDEKTGKIDFSHNPFSMPKGGMDGLLNTDPLELTAYQYDIVCNGVELCSGAIRNHLPEVMYKAFEIAGYGPEVVEEKFGGMLNAMKFGAPPHGGAAPGVDRMVMLLADEPNIREVVAFPMNQQAQDLMMGAPGDVMNEQLEELNIQVVMPPEMTEA